LDPLLNIGTKAAVAAGKVLVKFLNSLDRLQVQAKGRHDFVSEADQLSEETIIETVRRHYPGHGIIAEESGIHPGSGNDREKFEWIIDPLDGTMNYLHNHPDFTVSIAVTKNSILEHGIVFDPIRNDLYTASRNRGAQLNGKRMHVTHTRNLKRSIIAVGSPHPDYVYRDHWIENVSEIIKGVGTVRVTGSAALDLAHVATGRTDGYVQPSLKIWDIAAGCLLVREARGLVADWDGSQNHLENGCVVAAGTGIFSPLLALTQSAFPGITKTGQNA